MTIRSAYKSGGMFEGTSPLIFAKAKELRKNMTASETILWMHLKSGINGCKIRRQHPIGFYVADFFCYKARLVIEIDGPIHLKKEIRMQDQQKESDLESWGYKVIRFTNDEVNNNIEKVIKSITEQITKRSVKNGV